MDFSSDIATVAGIAAVPTILDVVSKTTGMGFVAIARVTEDRWITCASKDDLAFGLKPGDELKVETTICHEIRQSHQAVVIDDVTNDQVFCGHHTPAMYGFRSYISMPIILADGSFFGTLCAIDPKPRPINDPATIGMFRVFAELIAFHLEAARKLENSELLLADEKRTAELREQFIAVLGHDLRNPLASISAGLRLLGKKADAEAANWITHMQGSVNRMSGLIDNVLDFARGRLGGGIQLNSNGRHQLEPVMHQVVDELRLASPDRVIELNCSLPDGITCDPLRIGQLASNLIGNALTHGALEQPVRVSATTGGGKLQISVTNAGAAIPPETMDRLFEPFFRGEVRDSRQGLGLGLHIASQIAQAHRGRIAVTSTAEETRFVFTMPLASPAALS